LLSLEIYNLNLIIRKYQKTASGDFATKKQQQRDSVLQLSVIKELKMAVGTLQVKGDQRD
jgi:hypothetical protein